MKRWVMFAGMLLLAAGIYEEFARARRSAGAREHKDDLQTWETEGGTSSDTGSVKPA